MKDNESASSSEESMHLTKSGFKFQSSRQHIVSSSSSSYSSSSSPTSSEKERDGPPNIKRQRVEARRVHLETSGKRTARSAGRWTDTEVEALKRGHQTFGTRWKDILKSYPFRSGRTPCDLKDKWRNLNKHLDGPKRLTAALFGTTRIVRGDIHDPRTFSVGQLRDCLRDWFQFPQTSSIAFCNEALDRADEGAIVTTLLKGTSLLS